MAKRRTYGTSSREIRDAFTDWLYVNGFKFEKTNTIYGTDFEIMATEDQNVRIMKYFNALPCLLSEIEDIEFEVA